MPELPDVVVYLEALTRHVVGQTLQRINLLSPFVLRSVDPPIESLFGATVRGVRRVGKRIVFVFDDEVFLVIHLMIAGRLRWRAPGQKPGMRPRLILASFECPTGVLFFTEASSRKRASMQVVRGEAALRALDPGGIEPLDASLEQFHDGLTRENHTLKRALTDPHLFSGIGNAYSDEILHAARLSPLKLTRSLTDAEFMRLYDATRATLMSWVDRLRAATGGRFKQPCPVCGSPVQRIVYAENECNYCATCQTGGRLLADRSLSRLLKDDWPRRIDESNQ
jgi:formamidopyrimidine-DNA glycosylase